MTNFIKKNKSIKKIFVLLMLFTILLIHFFNFYNKYTNNFIALVTFGLCIYNLLKSKNNILLFLLHFQLLYYNYSVIFSRYLYDVEHLREFYMSCNNRVMGIGIACLCIFELGLTYFSKTTDKFSSSNMYADKPNYLYSYMLLAISLIIGIFGFNWNAYGSRGAVTPIYEYIGIFLVLGLFYTGKENKLNRALYCILIFLLIVQGLIYGERVSSLQFGFIWVLYFMGEKLTSKKLLLYSIVGLFGMTIVGSYRNSYNLLNFSLAPIVKTLNSRLLTFDGADLGYYCSLTFIKVLEQVNLTDRLNMFIKFILAIFLGESSESSLSIFTSKYYIHYFGGFSPLSFYFYGGIFLVIVVCFGWAKFICSCIRNEIDKHKKFYYIVLVYLVSITARWFMYSPVLAIRPLLLFTIVYFILKIFDKFKEKKNEIK